MGQDICRSSALIRNLGEFYKYSRFVAKDSTSIFKGVTDVDIYGNLIYVNRTVLNSSPYKRLVDIYEVDIPGGSNINQHPDNPNATRPVVTRSLKFIKSYEISDLSNQQYGELYAEVALL